MSNITVRNAKEEDCGRVVELLEHNLEFHHTGRPDIFKREGSKYSKDEYNAMMSDASRPVFVAVDGDGRVIGFAFCMVIEYKDHSVFYDSKIFYLDDLFVDAEFRGGGAGRLLVNKCIEYAKMIGCGSIELNVWEFDGSAAEFYKKCGMTEQRIRMEMKINR